jgi:guanosine-3',5'-bis(diphosphate) 3'-pyrophosphohydrolase
MQLDRRKFFALVNGKNARLDVDLITRAFDFSERSHGDQKRVSGEGFMTHCMETARILLDLGMDTNTIASGLIHDVVEDTKTTIEEVRDAFGDEIAAMVDGVTKIGGLDFRSTEERQVENYRKMLLSTARDVRIIIIKLADRVHNMRTLDALPLKKQRKIALETREIYAPMAHRFGMALIRAELEDLAFKYLEPEEYRRLVKVVAHNRRERARLISTLKTPLERELKAIGINAEVTGRAKNLYSIYKKMITRNLPYERIYDLLAIRVTTDSVRDCYHVLGLIHSLWKPRPDRIKDYISTPKSNMYQSLHTTVFGPGGHLFEIQIRTFDMHSTAEYGIAAHWLYKEGKAEKSELDKKLNWFRQIIEQQKEMTDPSEFMDYLKIDLFQYEIYVFTPKGDLKQLPVGSTPIDFAFTVHSEVGIHCAGARVNGKMVPLNTTLNSGDTVEIITSPGQKPSLDWIKFVKTSRARNKIRRWIREHEFSDSVRLGREILHKELKRVGKKKIGDHRLDGIARELGLKTGDQVLASLGAGDLSVKQILEAEFPEEEIGDRKDSALDKVIGLVRKPPKGIRVQGLTNVMVRFAQCCQPLPGDDVIGYVTRGHGVSVHRSDCSNVLQFGNSPERRVEIDWKSTGDESFLIRLVVRGNDRKGLFADVASAITSTSTNIARADIHAKGMEAEGTFVVQVQDLDQLQRVIAAMKKVKGIYQVERTDYVAGGFAVREDHEG